MDRKIHFVWTWEGITACGRDSLVQDLDQTNNRKIVTCKNCLAHFKKKQKRKIINGSLREASPKPPSAPGP